MTINEITFKGTMFLHVSNFRESVLGPACTIASIHEIIADMFDQDHENDVTRAYKHMEITIKQNIPQGASSEISFKGIFMMHKTDVASSSFGSGFDLPYAHKAIASLLSSNGMLKDMKIYNNVEITITQTDGRR